MAYAIGGMLTFDSERSGLAAGWLLTATRVLDEIVGEGNPLLQLAAPLARLVAGDGLAFPRVFDQAVDYPHPWISAVARVLRGTGGTPRRRGGGRPRPTSARRSRCSRRSASAGARRVTLEQPGHPGRMAGRVRRRSRV